MKSSGEITVSPVQNDASLWEFLRLPWHIYQGDPYWVPPILSQQRQFLDPRRGPFFEPQTSPRLYPSAPLPSERFSHRRGVRSGRLVSTFT